MGNLVLNGATSGSITLSPPSAAGSNTITLPAATGTMALTASPTFTGTVTTTTVTSPAATALTIQSAGTTALTIDTSQNVGIGTTTPASFGKFAVTGSVGTTYVGAGGDQLAFSKGGTNYISTATAGGQIQFQTGAGSNTMLLGSAGDVAIGGGLNTGTYKWLTITGPTTSGGGIVQLATSDSSVTTNLFCNNLAGYVGTGTSNPFVFRINSNEVARFDTSGNLLVGASSTNFAGSGFTLSTNSGTTKWLVGPTSSSPSNFYVAAGASVGVYLAGTSATSWTSGSDERLKNIIEPIENGLQKVNMLRAIIGSYKADEENTRRPFVIAQDLQKVLPEAVDASNPDALGVQYTEVIPLLVAAIQELSAKVAALEAK